MVSINQGEARGLAPLLADMGHQLRTPLNGVVGMAGVLGQTRLDSGQQQMAQVIESSGRALHALLNDILELARLEAGAFELDDQPFNLSEMAETLQRRLAPELLTRGAALRLVVSPMARTAEVMGDEAVVRQILLRLMKRAIAGAGPQELTVHLSLGLDGGVVFEIEGTRAAGSALDAGADLDIPLCRALAGAMGGALDVQAGPVGGEGGCRLLLPLRLYEAAA